MNGASQKAGVLRIERIEHEHLRALLEPSGVLALRLPMLDPQIARALADKVESFAFQAYAVEPGFHYFGLPLFEAHDPNARERYFREAPIISERIRRAAWPISPLDLVIGSIRVAWPAGVRTLHLGGRACAVGVLRTLKCARTVEPHVDDPIADAGYHADALSILATLSALVYLDAPPEGGRIRLWKKRLAREAYDAARRHDSEYALSEEVLGPPAAILQPEPGEAIIFMASRPHAITSFDTGRRITASTFFNFHGHEQAISTHA